MMDKKSEGRIGEMIERVMKVARGDYSVQIELSDKNDNFDSLATGINMMIDDVRHEMTERKLAENEKERILHSLQERYKELNCLYGIDEINRREGITIEEVLKEIVRLIPPSWQYPDITGGCITFENRKYKTRNFKKTKWMQRVNIIVNNEKSGLIEVCYLEERRERNGDPFLKEERNLMNAIAVRAGQIIERKQAEEELRSSEERLRILFEDTPDAYYLSDLKGNFIDGNKAAEEMSGYNREKLIGRNFLKLKLLSKKDILRAAALLAKNALGKPTGPDEFILKRKDDKQIAVEIRTFPTKIKGQTVVLSNARDITERKRAEEIIKKSLEEKEVLLREIHHRVKNNMQIISSLLRIQSGSIEDEKTQEMFYALHDRIKSMSLLYELLYQSKDIARVDLSEYIRSLTTHLVSMYRDRVGVINLKLDVKDVYLDLKRAVPCGLIITELVSNTLKHAFSKAERGEIAVEMHPDKGEKYTLVIRDSGKGFPEELDFRETESLGMKLVVDLVKQLKGTIELDRTKGTSFSIRFRRKR